ncbi:type II secretion system F family protein [Nocardioides dongxiaopingii]|uniref:type II secretion system F family protein n=1 Tax=Nocardioides sp. S-1144 TaxID=2582905 RepID=UPI00110F42F4|nr:type II secretion system F family protein [Nocardioides sp. S-1144]QCW51226.1 type II secretion system F family protein [Nocardioides sp. S-1144]
MLLLLGTLLVVGALVLFLASAGRSTTRRGVERSLELLDTMSTTPPKPRPGQDDRPFAERVLAPLQHRALVVGRRLSGSGSAERLRRRLDLAGNPRDWDADRVVSVKVLGATALLAVGAALALTLGTGLVGTVLLVVGGPVLGFFLPELYLYQAAYERTEQLQRELPDAIDLLTISVESGLGFDAACQQVARHTEGPLSAEFSRMLREMQIGQSRTAALRALAERTNVPDVRTFVTAMVQADAFGIPTAQVLRVQANEMRVRRRQRAEEKAQQVPVKITFPLVFFILPCLFVAVLGPAAITLMDNF